MAQDQPRKSGTLVFALNADIRSLEPGINRDGNADSVVHAIYEGLVAYAADASARHWPNPGKSRTRARPIA